MSDRLDFYGADTIDMAQKYGTPLYLLSEDYIVERCEEVRTSFLDKYDNTFAVYAGKAFSTKEMCRIINREGLGLDVVSGGELYTAIKAQFPMENIIFHGNNKIESELEMAIEHNVGRIVVDNLDELAMIQALSEKKSKKSTILFRINPGVDSYTHQYISTGQVDSKFGISIKTIRDAVKVALSCTNIHLAGFHFHVGSQLKENQSHLMAIESLLQAVIELKSELNFDTEEMNIGGGFGIYYSGDDERKPLSYFIDPSMEIIENMCNGNNLKRPKIIIEPGRWIIGEAGITLYTVGSIKNIPEIRKYIGIDGGMPDNPRSALYQAKYEAVIANKMDREADDLVTVAGKCCESGDILIWDLKIPTPQQGDILAVKSTGAYNYAMANNYNKLPIPPVVMIKEGRDRMIVRRQTFEDIISREI